METVCWLPKKWNRMTIWSGHCASGCRPERSESRNANRYLFTQVHSCVSHHSQRVRQPNCPLADDWINALWPIHAYNGVLFSLRRGGNSAIPLSDLDEPWMNLLSEISHSQKDTSTLWVQFSEVPRVAKFLVTDRGMVAGRSWGWG